MYYKGRSTDFFGPYLIRSRTSTLFTQSKNYGDGPFHLDGLAIQHSWHDDGGVPESVGPGTEPH